MSEIISQPQEMIGAFVNTRQGYPVEASWGQFNALGLMQDGKLVMGVIYNCFEGTNVNMHIGALDGIWATPQFLHAMFDYPFNQLGRRRITACMRSKNEKVISQVKRLGFEYEGTMRHYYIDDDMVFYGLLKEQCRLTARKAA